MLRVRHPRCDCFAGRTSQPIDRFRLRAALLAAVAGELACNAAGHDVERRSGRDRMRAIASFGHVTPWITSTECQVNVIFKCRASATAERPRRSASELTCGRRSLRPFAFWRAARAAAAANSASSSAAIRAFAARTSSSSRARKRSTCARRVSLAASWHGAHRWQLPDGSFARGRSG